MTRMPASTSVPARTAPHRRYLRAVLLAVALLLVLVGLFAWALSEIPPLARGPGARMVSKLIGRPVTLQRMRLDPFGLRVRIEGLQVGEAAAAGGLAALLPTAPASTTRNTLPFASLEALEVQLSAASLLRGYPVIRQVRIERPSIHLTRALNGQLNVQDLLDRFLKAPSSGPPPALVLNDVVLHDGALTWHDAGTGAHHALTGMELVLPWFSTRSEDAATAVTPQFYGRLDGRLLVLYANAAQKDRQEALAVHFEVEDLHLPAYTDLVPVPGKLQLRDGRFDARMDAHLRIQPGALPQLNLSGDFILRQLDVRSTPDAPQPLLSLDRLEVPVREYRAAEGLLHLGPLQVRGFSTHVRRNADGVIDWVQVLQRVEAARMARPASATTAQVPGSTGQSPARVRRLVLDGLDFTGGQATWDDLSTGTPVHLALREATLKVGEVHWPEADQAPFQLSLQGDRQEQVRLEGMLGTPGPHLQAHATLTRIDLQRLAPYFAGALPVRVESAPFTSTADLELALDADGAQATVHNLQLALPSLAVHERTHDQLLVRVHDLQISGLQADARAATVAMASLGWSALETGQALASGAASFNAVSASWREQTARIGTLDLQALRLPADGHAAIVHADGLTADLPAQRFTLHSLAAADLALPTGLAVGAVRVANAVAEPATGHYQAEQVNAAALAAPGNNQVGGVTLSNADVRLGQQHLVRLGSLNAVQLALGGRLDLPLIEVRNSVVDLDQHTFNLDLVHLADARLNLLRERDGTLNPGTALQALEGIPGYRAASAEPRRVAGPAAASNARTLGGWQGRLQQLKIDNASGSLQDAGRGPAATLGWQQVDLELSQLSTQATEPARFSLHGVINRSAQLSLKGRIRAAPLDGKLHLTLQGLSLPEWQAWLPAPLPLRAGSGTLDLDARLQVTGTVNAPTLALDGSTTLADVRLDAARNGETLLRWQRLSASGVHASNRPLAIHLQQVQLAGVKASLQLEADGAINLTRALSGAPASEATAPAQLAVVPASAVRTTGTTGSSSVDGSVPLTIDSIDLTAAELDFQDHFIRPAYAAHLNQVQGHLTGLSARAGSRGELTLSGTLDGGASVTVAGQINPLASPLFLDLQAQVHDFELGPLTSYSTRFTGYPIERGKLSFDIAYKLDHGRITAGNHLRLDQLTLGPRRDVPGLKSLPMDLAVSLLKDSDGVIQVDLPIEGTLTDPQFNLGGIIGQLVSRAVERAVTAPFRWLGTLFGGEHAEQFGWIGFAAGRDALDSVAVDKLQRLAQLLASKPGLRVDIRAYSDDVPDLAALAPEQRTGPDALVVLAGRRMRAAQDWLTGPGKVDAARVFIAGGDSDRDGSVPADASAGAPAPAARVQFTLH